jgi:Fe-S cluster assembly ATP-binding protein
MIASASKDAPRDFKSVLPQIGLHDNFLQRFLNEGFSGGEKKKSELLQMMARKPKIAICDEIDSGLDLDALKSVAKILRSEAERGAGLLLISHSPRLFELLPPDFVHVLLKGKLVASGGLEILEKLEKRGYKEFEK